MRTELAGLAGDVTGKLSSKVSVSYAELAKELFVRGTGGCADVLTPIARQAGVEFDVAFEAREMSAVVEIVRPGLGVSIVPSAGLPELPDGVVMRPLETLSVSRSRQARPRLHG